MKATTTSRAVTARDATSQPHDMGSSGWTRTVTGEESEDLLVGDGEVYRASTAETWPMVNASAGSSASKAPLAPVVSRRTTCSSTRM